jgi:flagellar basal-body rod protein FlgF
MDRMLYIAMSGAKEVSLAQANNSNNLANANTDGFKKDFNQFRAQHVEGAGWNSRAYSLSERPATDFSAGAVKVTGRSLDVMTKENGFFTILAKDGTEALSRTASLRVNSVGELVDRSNNPILNIGGSPISLPEYRKIEIAEDGTISVIPADAQNDFMVDIDQIKMVAPDIKQLTKDLDGHIRSKENNLEQANVKLVSGALETSNVNTVEALTTMIELSRKYEMQIKMMKIAKEHEQKSDSLVKLT